MSADPAADGPMTEDETLIERRYRFLSLRNAQLTFSQIAERYNAQQRELAAQAAVSGQVYEPKRVSVSTVRKDVERAKAEIIDQSTRESLIAEETSVLLDVRRANYGAMLGGDVDAAKLVLATVTQRRELWGLDAPKRAQLGVGTDVEFARDLVDLMKSVGFDAPADLAFAARGELEDRAATQNAIDAEVLDDPIPPPAPKAKATKRANPFVPQQDSPKAEPEAPVPTPPAEDLLPEAEPPARWSNL